MTYNAPQVQQLHQVVALFGLLDSDASKSTKVSSRYIPLVPGEYHNMIALLTISTATLRK